MLGGDPNLPNGGLASRFPGLYIPILDFSFNGPAATDTQFATVEITRQYDGFADFPLYPLNLIADLNAVLGMIYVHLYPFDVSLASRSVDVDGLSRAPTVTPATTSSRPQDLPLFAPLRMLGVPESVIDVFEPFFRVIVELGYDRSIPPWEPTPARLIPTLNPATVATDLVNAIGEGINNAAGPHRLATAAEHSRACHHHGRGGNNGVNADQRCDSERRHAHRRDHRKRRGSRRRADTRAGSRRTGHGGQPTRQRNQRTRKCSNSGTRSGNRGTRYGNRGDHLGSHHGDDYRADHGHG